MKHSERPTDMLLRQLLAIRTAARYRNPATKRRHFCHLDTYRAAFVRDILAIRKELRNRGVYLSTLGSTHLP